MQSPSGPPSLHFFPHVWEITVCGNWSELKLVPLALRQTHSPIEDSIPQDEGEIRKLPHYTSQKDKESFLVNALKHERQQEMTQNISDRIFKERREGYRTGRVQDKFSNR